MYGGLLIKANINTTPLYHQPNSPFVIWTLNYNNNQNIVNNNNINNNYNNNNNDNINNNFEENKENEKREEELENNLFYVSNNSTLQSVHSFYQNIYCLSSNISVVRRIKN